MFWDLSAFPNLVVPRCIRPIFPLLILCCHVNDIVVQTLTCSSHCSAYFAHHDIFDLFLKQLNILFKGSRLTRVIAEVVKLVHRVDTLETNLVCRLSAMPYIALTCSICVELSLSATQLASKAYGL